MVGDLPDYTKYITQQIDIPAPQQGPMIPRPKGGVKAKGSITTGASYAAVATITITNTKTFQVARILITAEYAAWVKWRWNGSDVGPEILLDDRTIAIIHFPWDYHAMVGDGVKAFDVQAKLYATAGLCNGEVLGEEI